MRQMLKAFRADGIDVFLIRVRERDSIKIFFGDKLQNTDVERLPESSRQNCEMVNRAKPQIKAIAQKFAVAVLYLGWHRLKNKNRRAVSPLLASVSRSAHPPSAPAAYRLRR